MPLTSKGKKIMSAMKEQYGKNAERVFYAAKNKGTIKGVDVMKAFKGAEADTKGSAGGKAMSPGTTTSGGVRFSGNGSSGSNAKNNKTLKNLFTKKDGNIPIIGPITFGLNVLQNLSKPKIEKNYGPYTKTKKTKINVGDGRQASKLCPDGTMPPCKTTPTIQPNKPTQSNFLKNFQTYNSGGVSFGPPPKRGPNPQVPPIKMKSGKMNNMSCPHRPDGIRGMGAAIKGSKFIGVK